MTGQLYDTETDADEGPTAHKFGQRNPLKRVKHANIIDPPNKDMMGILIDIQNRMTRMELSSSNTAKKMGKIEEDMDKLHIKSLGKGDLREAMSELTDSLQKDLDRHRSRIQKNEDQLTLLTDGVNATNINLGKLIKEQKSMEDEILKHKERMEQEKDVMARRMTEMENSIKALREKESKVSQDRPTADRDLKNLIFEGLNEIREEDVYDTVISTIRELGVNLYDNDINLAVRIGTYKGDNVWPRPIRVELVSTHVRNVIWQNRWKLENSMSHYNVRVSKDETKEVRQARNFIKRLQ